MIITYLFFDPHALSLAYGSSFDLAVSANKYQGFSDQSTIELVLLEDGRARLLKESYPDLEFDLKDLKNTITDCSKKLIIVLSKEFRITTKEKMKHRLISLNKEVSSIGCDIIGFRVIRSTFGSDKLLDINQVIKQLELNPKYRN